MNFTEHPLRAELQAEMNARPPAIISSPAQISHIASVTGENSAEADRNHIGKLCQAFKIAAPSATDLQFDADFGPFRLKWERHTEYSAYTLIKEAAFAQPFKDMPISELPSDWLLDIPGDVLTALHISIENGSIAEREGAALTGLFDNNPLVGGFVSAGRARIWTDFQAHNDGFLRFLVKDSDLTSGSLGRLVKRICEMETYRMMAMLALPPARNSRPNIAELEQNLSDILQTLAFSEGTDDEQQLLEQLSKVAAETERISASLNYRFSASKAYQELVYQRLEALQLESITGLQRLSDFLTIRFAPAMETRDNLMRRIETLSRRTARASDLLRTRVDVALEAQNRDLLSSMDSRAKLQLRLQQTVESLSVVAISYYLLGLIAYMVKGVAHTPIGKFEVDFVLMVVFVPVVFGVWWAVHIARKKVMSKKSSKD